MATDLDEAALLDAIANLVRVESPSSSAPAALLVAEHARDLLNSWLTGDARIDYAMDRPLVRWGPQEPDILILGHLDTVWPIGTLERIPWRIAGDRMHGPGVFDMKAGVVMAIAAVQSLPNTSGIGMLLTTDEEIGSPYSREAILASCAKARAALVFEPAADSAYKTRRKGTAWYDIHFHGRSAHAGLEPESGVNALIEAALFATDAATWANPPAGTTVTPTMLQAGTTANTVPDHATLTLDVRAWTQDELERVDEAVRGWQLLHADASTVVKGGIDRPALEADASRELFSLAQECARDLGLPALTEASVGGASDGNLTAAAGVLTLDGMGAAGGGAHAEHEWASVAELVPRTRIAAAVLQRLISS
jgi:glutamate carboxypeptidase